MRFISAEIPFIAEKGLSASTYIYPKSSGRKLKRPFHKKEMVQIYDARLLQVPPRIEINGFELLRLPTRVADFYDENDIVKNYYKEVTAFLKTVTSAIEVFIFDHTHRSVERANAGQRGIRMPAESAHVDYTPDSGPRRALEILQSVNAPQYENHRMALVNVWRPIVGPVFDFPIAICDPRTALPEDYVKTNIHHFNEDDLDKPELSGQIYSLRYNKSQRWYYCSQMNSEEVLLLRNWDSSVSDHSCYAAHTGFKSPVVPTQSKPRESIELRTLLVFD